MSNMIQSPEEKACVSNSLAAAIQIGLNKIALGRIIHSTPGPDYPIDLNPADAGNKNLVLRVGYSTLERGYAAIQQVIINSEIGVGCTQTNLSSLSSPDQGAICIQAV